MTLELLLFLFRLQTSVRSHPSRNPRLFPDFPEGKTVIGAHLRFGAVHVEVKGLENNGCHPELGLPARGGSRDLGRGPPAYRWSLAEIFRLRRCAPSLNMTAACTKSQMHPDQCYFIKYLLLSLLQFR